MKRLAVMALSVLFGVALADDTDRTVDRLARALVGVEYRLAPGIAGGQSIADGVPCTYVGGGLVLVNGEMSDKWAYSQLTCHDRPVAILEKKVDRPDAPDAWRIVDAMALPPFERDLDPKRPNALRLFGTGDCELDGKTDTLFLALVRWGSKRDRIDWRTGVERAWGFNLTAERIVPLSTTRIVCYRPEPA